MANFTNKLANRPQRSWLVIVVVVLAVTSAGLATSASAAETHGSYTIADFAPFAGASAVEGQFAEAQCDAVATEVNAAGGVLGHTLTCANYSSGSDPVDAVPIVNQMLATASNVLFMVGPTEVEPAVDPIINNAKLVHFAENTLPLYDHQTSPWFYRVLPSDSLAGVPEAITLIDHGYKHAAAVFSSSVESQTQVPSLLKTYKKLGGTVAANLTLTPDSTYRTEVAQLVAEKPDAIITELDPQTAATFFTEYAQQSNGPIPPVITTGAVLQEGNWVKVFQKAAGSAAVKQLLVVNPGGPNGPGYPALQHALMTAPEKIPDRSQWLNFAAYNIAADILLDGVLAIDEAKSTVSANWAPLVAKIANGEPNAVTVNTYAEAVKQIAAGHKVHFVGAGGAVSINRYHNISSPFNLNHYVGKAGWIPIANSTISPQKIAQDSP